MKCILKRNSTLHSKLFITGPQLLRVKSDIPSTTEPHMSLKLTPAAVETLRAAYGEINSVDPANAAYTGLSKLLDSLSQDDLKLLRDANIKWISSMAEDRMNYR
jgi:hypothetical protein